MSSLFVLLPSFVGLEIILKEKMAFQTCLQFVCIFKCGWKDRARPSWVWLKLDTPTLEGEDGSQAHQKERKTIRFGEKEELGGNTMIEKRLAPETQWQKGKVKNKMRLKIIFDRSKIEPRVLFLEPKVWLIYFPHLLVHMCLSQPRSSARGHLKRSTAKPLSISHHVRERPLCKSLCPKLFMDFP